MKYISSDSTLITGTNVLKNKLGITDEKSLEQAELEYFAARLPTVPAGNFNSIHLLKIHHHLFQDVYEWAGKFRNVPLSKGTSRFAQPQFIKQETHKALDRLDLERVKALPRKELAKELAVVAVDLIAIHPFRDGNGRTMRVFVEQIVRHAGYVLDLKDIPQKTWLEASIKGFHGESQPMALLLEKALGKE